MVVELVMMMKMMVMVVVGPEASDVHRKVRPGLPIVNPLHGVNFLVCLCKTNLLNTILNI